MNFGPLNIKGGERRLNVLITRAKMRCEVFTNLTADDINLTDNSPKGLKVLKIFLEYARSRQLKSQNYQRPVHEVAFQQVVIEALNKSGYQAVANVGQAGYFVDIAVLDPQDSSRYLLGIELDGENYNSAQSARDRDRLRPMVMHSLGWRIVRLWSAEWFNQPDQALQSLHQALEDSKT
jgi:very-short-patch-repair endonuclease